MSVNDKLNILSILESIDKIIRYSSDYDSSGHFYKNEKEFDASMMNFIIIGEMVSRFSDLFIEENNQIDWFKIRGFRNIADEVYKPRPTVKWKGILHKAKDAFVKQRI